MVKSLERMLRDVPKRFEALYIPEPMSGCWLWLGNVDRAGYGRFTIGRPGTHKFKGAHIISYILAHKCVPIGEVDHICKVRCCVNPDHLEDVSRTENIRRSDSPGGRNFRKTHCPSGHEFTAENTYLWKNRRHCKTCRKHRRKTK